MSILGVECDPSLSGPIKLDEGKAELEMKTKLDTAPTLKLRPKLEAALRADPGKEAAKIKLKLVAEAVDKKGKTSELGSGELDLRPILEDEEE